jgi:hypothetical protein
MSRGYNDKPIPVSPAGRKCNDDPMDDLGRQHWTHSNAQPIEDRPLSAAAFHSGKMVLFPEKGGKEQMLGGN